MHVRGNLFPPSYIYSRLGHIPTFMMQQRHIYHLILKWQLSMGVVLAPYKVVSRFEQKYFLRLILCDTF